MIAPARRAAFDVVRRVFEDGAYADRAFAAAADGLDDRDRALAQRIAYGTVQRKRTIDTASTSSAGGRCASSTLLCSRRSGSRATSSPGATAPAHAVADDAVELVRAPGLERAVAVHEAVMRRLAEGFPASLPRFPRGR